MKAIGYYGGSFDPVHFGHLNVCYSLLELGLVKEIFIAPTVKSPLKTNFPEAPFKHRLKMLELAFSHEPRVKILDIESQQPAYTIDTLHLLKEKYPQIQFRLILGSDLIETFKDWKNHQELILNFDPIVVSRNEGREHPAMHYQKIPLMEISATQIRERIKNKLKIDHLVPSKVVDYIYFHHLYSLNFKEKKL